MKRRLMLDSGAYSAWTQGQSINLDEYIAFVHQLLESYPDLDIEYVNLDVIGEGEASYRNWEEMRKSGLDPLPVYHPTTDTKWLEKYLDRRDYIGLGGIAPLSDHKRVPILDRIFRRYLVDKDGLPLYRVHGMGMTSFGLMKRYPWYSVDSVSWLMKAAYGQIHVPRRTQGKWDYLRTPHTVGVSDRNSGMKLRFETLSPQAQGLVLRYLNENGFRFGKVRKNTDGSTEVIEEGVMTSCYTRACANALLYSRVMQTLRYPRPIQGKQVNALIEPDAMQRFRTGGCDSEWLSQTILYLGGAITDLSTTKFILQRPEDFPCIGFLVSYWEVGKNSPNWKRLIRLMIRGEQ